MASNPSGVADVLPRRGKPKPAQMYERLADMMRAVTEYQDSGAERRFFIDRLFRGRKVGLGRSQLQMDGR